MESVGSNSPRPDRRLNHRQLVEDRMVRALQHRLRLLHRSDADFFVLGATGNVYTVTLCMTPTCTCPDRTAPCKHILFVFLRVLGVSLDDACLRRRSLRPCQLIRLLGLPTSPEAVAGPRTRERFHQLYREESRRRREAVALRGEEEQETSTCPVCMEEMGKEERLVECGVCRNCLHEECFQRWKSSRGRRVANCVICRARWRERKEHERRYMNLSAYIVEEDGGLPGGGGGGGGLCGI